MDLRTYLFMHKYTVNKFSEELGLHRNTISGLLTGKRPCSLATAMKIEKKTRGQVSLYELPLTEEAREMMMRSFEQNSDEHLKKLKK